MIAPDIRTRLRLQTACLQYLADIADARVLHVKGEALHPLLAADRPASSDCDVLVHPEDVAMYTHVLESNGWTLHSSFAHGSVFGHAATYYHPNWGTVDVHRSFPGLDHNPELTFGTLWESREQRVIGGIRVAVPDLLRQRLILLVHAARDVTGRAPHDRRVAWDDADEPTRHRVEALAAQLGGTVPLLVATGRGEQARGLPQWRTWQAMERDANPTEIWLARLLDADSPLASVRILGASLRPNRDHLALRIGHTPSARDVAVEAVARLGRGTRRLRRLAVQAARSWRS